METRFAANYWSDGRSRYRTVNYPTDQTTAS